MQITDPITNPRLFIEQTRADTLQQLRPGQVVKATVITPVEKGVVQLNLGSVTIPVKTGIKLEVGQQLNLDVVKAGKMPEFRLIRATEPEAVQAVALKSILPKQLPVQQLLDALNTLRSSVETTAMPVLATPKQGAIDGLFRQLVQTIVSSQPGARQDATPNPLERNLQTITSALQTTAGSSVAAEGGDRVSGLTRQIGEVLTLITSGNTPVTADTIRQAFELSGLFLEARLAAGQPAGADIKANLLKLLAELQPMTAHHAIQGNPAAGNTGNVDTGTTLQLLAARILNELHHLTDGALARVQLHQLASLPHEDNPHRQIWQFELPIAHPEGHDDFMLQFERETNRADPTDVRWSVLLNFDIPPAGPISARLNLVDDEISSHFTAEQPEGAARLEASLPQLNEAFLRAGLKVGKLTTRQGETTRKPDPVTPPFPLLDEKA